MNRKELADKIILNLESNKHSIEGMINQTIDKIGYFYIDNLLPEEYAIKIFNSFPKTSETNLKKNIREYKYVGVQMDKYERLLEESIYAFQDQRIVDFISDVFELKAVSPDPQLYAGGISIMEQNNFLKPHIDNSHDKDVERWRVLNLLYYVTPEWDVSYGGNLEIWSNGMQNKQNIVHSKFNRLVVMATHNESWHSVSPVKHDGRRLCISNYYFSKYASRENQNFHVTSFRGWPKEKIYGVALKFDTCIRMFIRKFFKYGVSTQHHIYKNKKD